MFKNTRSASSSRENRETGRSKRVRRQGEDERNRARQKREPAHMCAQTHPKKHALTSSCAFGPRGPGLSPGRSGRETRGAPGPRRGRAPPSPRPQSAASGRRRAGRRRGRASRRQKAPLGRRAMRSVSQRDFFNSWAVCRVASPKMADSSTEKLHAWSPDNQAVDNGGRWHG